MPSPISLTLDCPKYLIRYLEALFGKQPIQLPRRHPFASLFNKYLRRAPSDYVVEKSDPEKLNVILPYFEDKNVLYNYYLSPLATRIIINAITDSLKVEFRREVTWMDSMRSEVNINVKDMILNFIDEYKLGEDCEDMLMQDYKRYRRNVRVNSFREKIKRNPSVKEPFCPSCNTL